MRYSFVKFALSGLLLLPALAKADTFNFSLAGSGGGFNGSGTLTGTKNTDGSYTLTGITGAGITGLISPTDPNNSFGNDNLLFPGTSRLLDINGFAFTDLVGGVTNSVNIFLNSTQNGYESFSLDSLGNYADTTATFSVRPAAAATPEPSSVLLFATGLLGVTALGLRRKLAQ